MKPAEKYPEEFLLELAVAANIPPKCAPEQMWFDLEFPSKDGWKVSVFYDGDEMDCINHFIAPDGEKIDWFWKDEALDGVSNRLVNFRV